VSRHAEPNFLAYKRGVDGQVESESAFDPWDSAIDEIDQRNGYTEPGVKTHTALEQAHEVCVQASAKGLADLFRFAFEGVELDSNGVGLQIAIRRFAAVAQLVNSNLLRAPHPQRVASSGGGRKDVKRFGPVISPNELARQVRSRPQTLEKMAAHFARQWGFRVRIQKRRKGETAAD